MTRDSRVGEATTYTWRVLLNLVATAAVDSVLQGQQSTPRYSHRVAQPKMSGQPRVVTRRVGVMISQQDVFMALSSSGRNTVNSSAYVRAVLNSYVEFKFAKGRSKYETSYKLELLEQQMPMYAAEFHAVRAANGLGPSRVLPPPRNTQPQSHTQVQQPLMSREATINAARSLQGRNVDSAARRNVTTVRPTDTSNGGEGDEPPPPPYTRQDPEPDATRQLQERLAAEEERAEFSAPPGPPPTSSTPTAQTSQRPPSPLTAEEREIREQSEMEEAQRQSAMEKEKYELEEAVRLSLQAAAGYQTEGAGPSRPSLQPGGEDSDSRRASSYQPYAQRQVEDDAVGPPAHRRTISDAAGMGRPVDTTGLQDQMERLSIPSDWQQSPTVATPQDSIMDRPELMSMSQAPLEPVRTGMRSNNPFLSVAERAASSSQPPPLPARAPTLVQTPTGTASSHTIYEAPSGPPPPSKFLSPQNTATTSYPPPTGPPPMAGPSRQMSIAGRRGDLSRQLTEKGAENPLEMLRNFDTVFLVDDSSSMAGSRWEQARDSIMDVAEQAAKYDADGVDVYFLNDQRKGLGLTTSDQVENFFRGVTPRGATPTGLRIEQLLLEYLGKLERMQQLKEQNKLPDGQHIKPMNLIVITDGAFALPVLSRSRAVRNNPSLNRAELLQAAPTDDPESVLVNIARRLDRGLFPLSQVGVQLLQIGNDPEAREALQELDDGLSSTHGVRDIVDTVPFNGEAMSAALIVKVLLGGINRRLDRRDAV